ncbi:MAG: oligosaccharide flippase family protein [Alphaproteobacteria bacterium]
MTAGAPGVYHRLCGALRSRTPFGVVARGSLSAAMLQGINAVLGFATALLLARLLGAAGYGAYSFSVALLTILGIPGSMGFAKLFTREVARLVDNCNWPELRGLLWQGNGIALVASLTLTGLVIGACWALRDSIDSEMCVTLSIVILALPLLVFTSLFISVLRGLEQVVKSLLPIQVVQPALLLVLVMVFATMVPGAHLSASSAGAMYVTSMVAALLLAAAFLAGAWPDSARHGPRTYRAFAWVKAGLLMSVVASVNIIILRTDVVMLGVLAESRDVGIYNAATRLVLLVAFGTQALQYAMAPRLSVLSARGDKAALQRLLFVAACATTSFALPVAGLYVFFGAEVLLLFGNEFLAGTTALTLLAMGQFMAAVLGPASFVLVMSGHERVSAICISITCVANVVLNAILIPSFGMVGASVATLISQVAMSSAMALVVWRNLGVLTPVFFILRPSQTRN